MSDWIPPAQNVADRESDWFRAVYCSHKCFCGCGDPVRHLASISAAVGYQPPPGSRQAPGSSGTPPLIRGLRALPAAPSGSSNQQCGGTAGRGTGGDRSEGGEPTAAEDPYDGDAEELLAALEDVETSKKEQIRGTRKCRRRLQFKGAKMASVARLTGSGSPELRRGRKRGPDADPPAPAPRAPPRAESPQVPDQIRHQAAHENTKSPPRTILPLVGPRAYLFPKRLPQVWTKQDWETEYQTCAALDRPARTNLSSPPFYPWLPRAPQSFKVSFKLGFQP
ncbi:hypothetical protein TTV8_gp1 [Torque teno virus 8]|uniref:Hepatitis TT virus Orf2/Gyrovirus Vp2 N-terminal domain-containing protein n=2 Tax=Torque teno virus 8 TaxID=687347 RepID=Q91PT0_9VIRU|nr:hypothetical protein TTV8_gp1 [Torque teno virus 8]BAB61604.1 unnamed protein product [Torque teno virus 8]